MECDGLVSFIQSLPLFVKINGIYRRHYKITLLVVLISRSANEYNRREGLLG